MKWLIPNDNTRRDPDEYRFVPLAPGTYEVRYRGKYFGELGCGALSGYQLLHTLASDDEVCRFWQWFWTRNAGGEWE